MIELCYVSFNRLECTKESFTALVEHTDWSLISRLHVCDDASTDGSAEWLRNATTTSPVPVEWHSAFGGPVAAMNAVADALLPETERFCKIDNDFLCCPRWLNTLVEVMDATPRLDVLGLEAGFGEPVQPVDAARSWRSGPHIGGIGLIRRRVFDRGRPTGHGNGGRFGWTEFQRRHRGLIGWLTPDLPCFALDRLPFEPWRSLTERYVAQGVQRRWPEYPSAMADYWSWWL